MQNINERIKIILEKTGKTKTAFAESLKVSQQYISKLIRTGNPSDLLIEDICQKYNINENWLRTGNGEMMRQISPCDEVGYYVEELLEDYKDNPFYDMIIDMMKTYSELDEKSQKVLQDCIKKFRDNIKNAGD